VLLGIAYGMTRHTWVDGALTGLTLAVSMVPEEFPVVLTIFLALGAWRIARSRVLTRRLPAIETLGSATVLCVDKTGTLTANRMTITSVITGAETRTNDGAEEWRTPELAGVVRTAARASKRGTVDPMERAFFDFVSRTDPPADAENGTLVHEYPLTDRRLAVVHVWRHRDQVPAYDVAAKGAPETILSLCRMAKERRASAEHALEQMAGQGLRVLGVAHASWNGALPDAP